MNAEDYLGLADVRPNVIEGSGVPFCSDKDCPSYDGKRCRITGFVPAGICEPAVVELVRLAGPGRH